MGLLIAAIVLMVISGLPSAFRASRFHEGIAAFGIAIGGLWGIMRAGEVLLTSSTLSFSCPWSLPGAQCSLALDPLSALFLIPTFVIGIVTSLYGMGYLRSHGAGRSPFFVNLLIASIAVVFLARNGILFLISWEVMALASYFLVTHEDCEARVRRAGLVYLIATHIGTACLLAFFTLLASRTGSFEFAAWRLQGGAVVASGFLLAIIGFGTKAGLVPLHIWLPEAHPAAPSHVSAIMSGVMIKTGIYGVLRMLTLVENWPASWGMTLLAIGMVTSLVGILSALSRQELKAILAYSSIENMGIICMGIGIGIIGIANGVPATASLGFAGALLHVVNHAVFKGLLFMGAGAVIQQSGSGNLNVSGGLLKRMPQTGCSFFLGSAALAALPPLTGFVSELMIVLAAIALITAPTATLFTALPAMLALATIGLVGALAVACYTRLFGIVFLGEARNSAGACSTEPHRFMRIALVLMSSLILVMCLLIPWIVPMIDTAVQSLGAIPIASIAAMHPLIHQLLMIFSVVTAILIVLIVMGLLTRRELLARQEVRSGSTWGCGYAAPTARMQYTATSFAEPLMTSLGTVAGHRREYCGTHELYPQEERFVSNPRDLAQSYAFEPLFTRVKQVLTQLHVIQHGNVHLYIFYIIVALVALLIWAFGGV